MSVKFAIGIVFLALSYLQLLLPRHENYGDAPPYLWITLTVLGALFMLGIIFLSEGVTEAVYEKSLLRAIFKNAHTLIAYLALSMVGAIMLDGVSQWLGKLWFYPVLNNATYPIVFVFSFALYWLMVIESYLAVKALLDLWRKGRHTVRTYFGFEPPLYTSLGALGIILIPIAAALMTNDYAVQRGGYVFELTKAVDYKVNFSFILLMFFGTWFLFEAIEYFRKETSLLRDIFHHYFTPLIAVVVASLGTALLMETQNLFAGSGAWTYTNWPFQEVTLLGLPAVMFFFWPIHYIFFLSLWRAFSDKESDEVWKGDLIK
ncbi:MAG: hypothetical protein HYW65_01545 [Candidatus Liptonbacteria bacterium]|nr:hypothetical protein [Candidatus Liptonbacteria bacterium]